MILESKTSINAPAKLVYEYLLEHMSTQRAYQEWHPEHKVLKWIKGEPFKKDSILYSEEYLGDNLQKIKFKIVNIIPDKLIHMRTLFPLSLIAPYNKFIIESTGDNSCILITTGKINMSEKMFINSHEYHEEKLRLTRQHMDEEGENIKKAVENK